MARKPKAASSAKFATWIEEDLPTLADTRLPARRGRKPEPATSAAEPLATMTNDEARAGITDLIGSSDDAVMTPVRKRSGPQPKQKPARAAAAPLQKGPKTKPGRTADAPAAVPHLAPAEDDVLDARPTGEHGETAVQSAALLETTGDAAANGLALPLLDQGTAAPAQPAAQWDRAADTVRFDWPEIERTAAQDGPDQVMAKLLVAARAEGANSRWPL